MNSRRVLIYVVSFTATAAGLWLAFGGKAKPPATAPGPESAAVKSAPQMLGGYMGSGRAQVSFDGAATKTVAAPAKVDQNMEVGTAQKMEGERRMEELKQVLANIEGEPVYVEGIDGPVPEKKPKRK